MQQIAGEDVLRYNLRRFVSKSISISGFVVPAFTIVYVEDTMAVRYDVSGDSGDVFDDDQSISSALRPLSPLKYAYLSVLAYES